jgi:hypothetical protein
MVAYFVCSAKTPFQSAPGLLPFSSLSLIAVLRDARRCGHPGQECAVSAHTSSTYRLKEPITGCSELGRPSIGGLTPAGAFYLLDQQTPVRRLNERQ